MFHPDKVYKISNKRPSCLHEHPTIIESTTTHPYPVVIKCFGMPFLSHHNYTPIYEDLSLVFITIHVLCLINTRK